MQRRTLLALTTALLSSGLSFVALPTTANAGPVACGRSCRPNCWAAISNTRTRRSCRPIQRRGRSLTTSPARPRAPAKVPVTYCLVVLSYSSTPANDPTPQNITIYVGLPLNSMDGGVTGSTVNPPNNFTTVEGNWNGRTEGQGGGGCTGNTNVNSAGAVANGFVGSGTDGGHGSPTNDPGNTCQPGRPQARPTELPVYRRTGFITDPSKRSSGRRRLPSCITARRRNTTTGTAVRPAVIRAMPWLKRSPANWTASWPTRRRCTGRVSRPRRCGARLRCTISPKR